MARPESGWLADAAATLSGRDREGRLMMTAGTKEDPWVLTTPPGTSTYTMYRDEQADPPVLVCQVGSTTLKYHLQAIGDLHGWLAKQGDWVPLGAAGAVGPMRGSPPRVDRSGGGADRRTRR